MLFEPADVPLRLGTVPQLGAGELLIRVKACDVRRTELHLADSARR